jgi:hypothetical protein
MTTLEVLLRLSVIQAELTQIAETADPRTAKLATYAARVLGLAHEPADRSERQTHRRCPSVVSVKIG